MQVTKDYIKKNIQEAASKLFLEKGYPNVSMREIAETAQVGLSNIYNYFKNKDEIFQNVVQPALSAFDRILQMPFSNHASNGFSAASFQHDVVAVYLLLIRNYRSEINLLLFHAHGSALQNFKDEFTERITAKFKESLSQRPNSSGAEATDFSIHLHSVWLFTLFEEILKCDAPDEELEAKINDYIHFESQGYREFA